MCQQSIGRNRLGQFFTDDLRQTRDINCENQIGRRSASLGLQAFEGRLGDVPDLSLVVLLVVATLLESPLPAEEGDGVDEGIDLFEGQALDDAAAEERRLGHRHVATDVRAVGLRAVSGPAGRRRRRGRRPV